MTASDFAENPFTATFNKLRGAHRQGEKESRQQARDEWSVGARDWLSGQEHGRSMEFMQAQHANSFDMERMRGSETRLNMRHAQKNGLSDFSQSMGADGSHSTSFSLRKASQALVEETATRPPAGQAVIPVGGPVGAPEKPAAASPAAAAPVAPAGAPAAPKAAPRTSQRSSGGKALGAGISEISAKLNGDSGVQASDEKPGMAPPAHSGKASKGARQHKLF